MCILKTIERSLHSKSTSILYKKQFYSALLRYHFMIHWNIHIQMDGILMVHVLGPIFCRFCLSDLENKGYNIINKLNIYSRYADSIFLLTKSTDEINMI